MEELYNQKGGVDEFNCVNLKLTLEDLERLKLEASELKPTMGFFFGSQNPMEPEDVEDVVSFCDEAIKEIEEGNTVVYSAWY
jgi:predicted DNA-binding protein